VILPSTAKNSIKLLPNANWASVKAGVAKAPFSARHPLTGQFPEAAGFVYNETSRHFGKDDIL
jgi:hypothetical protein